MVDPPVEAAAPAAPEAEEDHKAKIEEYLESLEAQHAEITQKIKDAYCSYWGHLDEKTKLDRWRQYIKDMVTAQPNAVGYKGRRVDSDIVDQEYRGELFSV